MSFLGRNGTWLGCLLDQDTRGAAGITTSEYPDGLCGQAGQAPQAARHLIEQPIEAT